MLTAFRGEYRNVNRKLLLKAFELTPCLILDCGNAADVHALFPLIKEEQLHDVYVVNLEAIYRFRKGLQETMKWIDKLVNANVNIKLLNWHKVSASSNIISSVTKNPEYAVYGRVLAPIAAGSLAFRGTQLMNTGPLRRLVQVGIGTFIGYNLAIYLETYSGNAPPLQKAQHLVDYLDTHITTTLLGSRSAGTTGGVFGAFVTALVSRG